MNDDVLASALALVKAHLGDTAARELEIKIEDADRIKVIRDAFLEGRDRDAVTLMQDLVKWGALHEGNFRFLPTSANEIAIQPEQTAQITARPQTYAFKPLALLVSEQSREFLINDIRVGTRSQFLQAGEVPADVLTPIPAALDVILFAANAGETAVEAKKRIEKIDVVLRADALSRAIVPIECDICLTAQDIVLVVTNPTTQPLLWRSVWLGKDLPNNWAGRREDEA